MSVEARSELKQTQAIVALSALAQDTRLSVFRKLVQAGPSGMLSGEIAEAVGVLPSTMSHHLGQLERAGLVRSHRQGRTAAYAADHEGMRRLLAFLMEDCCQGRAEICGAGPASVRTCSEEEICS